MLQTAQIGVIGGSGLYNMPEITDTVQLDIETPFGKPSAPIVIGSLHNKRVAFLPRHGAGHIYTPSTIPYRANIYALKSIGVRYIISISACGSLREDYKPGDIVIPDQLYDNTKLNRNGRSFFETGFVAHIGVADPFDAYLSDVLYDAANHVGATVHKGGHYITIEGPRFSTKGESKIFRQWDCDLIGMTTSPEAFLAAEAEIAYACIAHITDYDVWHETESPVTVDMVMATARKNIDIAKNTMQHAIKQLDEQSDQPIHNALANAITTPSESISDDTKTRLKAIVSKYLD